MVSFMSHFNWLDFTQNTSSLSSFKAMHETLFEKEMNKLILSVAYSHGIVVKKLAKMKFKALVLAYFTVCRMCLYIVPHDIGSCKKIFVHLV